jgi:transcription initiation factor TFIIH subunit 4
VYAYGGSALQAALLRLFVRCEAVLPGLWVGTLTRESIIGATNCFSAPAPS